MAYRDWILSGAGGYQPEIWAEFENTLDGSGYGTRGDDPFTVQIGAGPTFGAVGSGIPGEWGGRSGIFNGSTRIASGLATSSFAFFTTSTFGVWIKTTDTDGTFMQFGSGTSTSSNYWRMGLVGGKVRIQRHSATTIITSTRTVNDGNWHFIAFKKDGATSAKLFIDGTLEANYTTSWSPNTSGFLYLGGDVLLANNQTNYFSGELDHAMHWPGGITDQQIADHYTEGMRPAPKVVDLDTGGTNSPATVSFDGLDINLTIISPNVDLNVDAGTSTFSGSDVTVSIVNPPTSVNAVAGTVSYHGGYATIGLAIEVDAGNVSYTTGDVDLTIVNPPISLEIDVPLVGYTGGEVELSIITPPMFLEVDAGTVVFETGDVIAIPLGPPIEITTDAIAVATFTGMADYTVTFTEATLPVQIKLDVEFTRGVIKNRLTSNLHDAKIRRSNEDQTLVSVASVEMKKPRPVVTLNMKENEDNE